MIKVLLVDDEVLAMDYLHNLIEWDELGYTIIGHAANGKKAIEMFEKNRPDIVISDIKMVGMDGLELTRQLKQMNPETAVILLSAYKDFEYAQKGFEYGVSNYLLKHELCEEKLLAELEKVREKLEAGVRNKKIYQKYFARQLIYNQTEADTRQLEELGNRFFLVLLHRDSELTAGEFRETAWLQEELDRICDVVEEDGNGISYVSDVQLSPGNMIIMYRIEKIKSQYTVNSLIEQKCRNIAGALKKIPNCFFNIIYSGEITQKEISSVFQKMSGHIRCAVFWKPCCAYGLSELKKGGEEKRIAWNETVSGLKAMIEDEDQEPEEFVRYLFGLTRYPEYNLNALRELIHILESLIGELETETGIRHRQPEGTLRKADEIQRYYVDCIEQLHGETWKAESNYSRQVRDMIRYIRKNYDQEISLETLGDKFQMNGVYLGQIFKREVGVTFLKYLTNMRVNEAKRLLDEGGMNIAEVAERVGYKTSQYFSQIFLKVTGVKPQEYKKWSGRKQEKDI